MIYRIRIMKQVDGKLVFDRYATPEEMKLLRVNADGKVEKLRSSIHKSMLREEFTLCSIELPNGKSINIYGLWLDVSATHFVEWGFTIGNKTYYQNDILKVWVYRYDDEPELNQSMDVVIEYCESMTASLSKTAVWNMTNSLQTMQSNGISMLTISMAVMLSVTSGRTPNCWRNNERTYFARYRKEYY